MPSFEEHLKNSLDAAMPAGTNQADSDLREEVTKAAQSVESISGGKASLELHPLETLPYGTHYALVLLRQSPNKPIPVTRFFVASKGYEVVAHGGTEAETKLTSRPQIAAALLNMVQDASSPLVQHLPFAMRGASDAPALPYHRLLTFAQQQTEAVRLASDHHATRSKAIAKAADFLQQAADILKGITELPKQASDSVEQAQAEATRLGFTGANRSR